MRFLGMILVVCLMALAADRASAQGYCPFLEFCDAQQRHCHQNCGALSDVIVRPARPDFVQQCVVRCDWQFNRCTARGARRCVRHWW
jgi:hypothetical protein